MTISPLHFTDTRTPDFEALASSQVTSRRYRILIIEDDLPVARLLMLNLTRHGFEANHAADGELAIEAFEEVQPDLVMLDLDLPGKNGFDVCEHLRRRGSVPIIILTAIDDPACQMRILKLGADDYIAKPFDPQLLMFRITARLRRTYVYNGERSQAEYPTSHLAHSTPAPQQKLTNRLASVLSRLPFGWAGCNTCQYMGPAEKFERRFAGHDQHEMTCPNCKTAKTVVFSVG